MTDLERFNKFIPIIWEHEVDRRNPDQITNYKNDLGKETKYGISIQFLKAAGIDIDNDGDIDVNDLKVMNPEKAKEIYLQEFFIKMNLSFISNDLLALHLLDMGVNAGTKSSIRLLQLVVKTGNDGILGNMTKKAVESFSGNLIKEYEYARIDYYDRICIAKPSQLENLPGWHYRVKTTVLS